MLVYVVGFDSLKTTTYGNVISTLILMNIIHKLRWRADAFSFFTKRSHDIPLRVSFVT